MTKYKFTTPFYCWSPYNQNYKFNSYSIEEAAASALAEHPKALILVNAHCTIAGRPDIANVHIQAWQTDQRTPPQILALIEEEIDAQIRTRTRSITHNQCFVLTNR